jgi:hypothetical protein
VPSPLPPGVKIEEHEGWKARGRAPLASGDELVRAGADADPRVATGSRWFGRGSLCAMGREMKEI